jgi:hypothetical protein
MVAMAVMWDARNLAHLVSSGGRRGITPSEVEEVIANPASVRRRLRGGRRAYQGWTGDGRRLLAVIVEVQGADRLRPRTAWEVTT